MSTPPTLEEALAQTPYRTTIAYQLTATVGALLRGKLKRLVLAYCHQNGISASVFEDKGLLESLYVFDLFGPSDKICDLISRLEYLQKGK